MQNAATVDEYLADVESEAARKTLSALRAMIKRAVPEAEEVISYGVPSYKLHGMLASFAAFKNHCSFFPGTIVSEFRDELAGYKTSKGTIQFPLDEPLPEALVMAILHKRVQENKDAQVKRANAKRAKSGKAPSL